MAATVAGAEPEIAAKNMDATTVTRARPPEREPMTALARWISLLEIPPFSIKAPAIIKKGIAIKGKESVAVNIFWATTIRGTVWKMNMALSVARPRLTAIGTLSITRATKTPKRT
jgi:hypothetical protein